MVERGGVVSVRKRGAGDMYNYHTNSNQGTQSNKGAEKVVTNVLCAFEIFGFRGGGGVGAVESGRLVNGMEGH